MPLAGTLVLMSFSALACWRRRWVVSEVTCDNKAQPSFGQRGALGWYLGVDELPDLVLLEKEVGVHEVTCNNKAQPRVRAASLSSQRGQKCINV